MTVAVNLRKLLHRKSPEYCTPSPAGNTGAGVFIVGDKTGMFPKHDGVVLVQSANGIWNYNPDEDGWMQLPNSGAGGTFGAGSCGCLHPRGMVGGANTVAVNAAGTTTTLRIAPTLVRNLVGVKLLVVSGANAGYEGTIVSNTVGAANCTLTVTPAAAANFDATSVITIYSGSLWFVNAGTIVITVYDRATNTWTAKSASGAPTTLGTDAVLVPTPGMISNNGAGFVTGTSSGSNGAASFNDTSKNWTNANWTGYQIRITGGTGAGQIREISSSMATSLGITTNWLVTPDATSTYVIEGNDNYLYLIGSNAVTLYRYSISGNTWSTLAPGAARAAAPGAGCTGSWIDAVPASNWSDGSYGAVNVAGTLRRQLGRYIYSFQGSGTSSLHVYDLAGNTWITQPYSGQSETFSTGSSAADSDGSIFLQKDATGRIYRFDVAGNYLEPFTTNPVPNGTAVVGSKMFVQKFREGSTEITFLYTLNNTRSELTRWLVV